jgi:hypothetical protein
MSEAITALAVAVGTPPALVGLFLAALKIVLMAAVLAVGYVLAVVGYPRIPTRVYSLGRSEATGVVADLRKHTQAFLRDHAEGLASWLEWLEPAPGQGRPGESGPPAIALDLPAGVEVEGDGWVDMAVSPQLGQRAKLSVLSFALTTCAAQAEDSYDAVICGPDERVLQGRRARVGPSAWRRYGPETRRLPVGCRLLSRGTAALPPPWLVGYEALWMAVGVASPGPGGSPSPSARVALRAQLAWDYSAAGATSMPIDTRRMHELGNVCEPFDVLYRLSPRSPEQAVPPGYVSLPALLRTGGVLRALEAWSRNPTVAKITADNVATACLVAQFDLFACAVPLYASFALAPKQAAFRYGGSEDIAWLAANSGALAAAPDSRLLTSELLVRADPSRTGRLVSDGISAAAGELAGLLTGAVAQLVFARSASARKRAVSAARAASASATDPAFPLNGRPPLPSAIASRIASLAASGASGEPALDVLGAWSGPQASAGRRDPDAVRAAAALALKRLRALVVADAPTQKRGLRAVEARAWQLAERACDLAGIASKLGDPDAAGALARAAASKGTAAEIRGGQSAFVRASMLACYLDIDSGYAVAARAAVRPLPGAPWETAARLAWWAEFWRTLMRNILVVSEPARSACSPPRIAPYTGAPAILEDLNLRVAQRLPFWKKTLADGMHEVSDALKRRFSYPCKPGPKPPRVPPPSPGPLIDLFAPPGEWDGSYALVVQAPPPPPHPAVSPEAWEADADVDSNGEVRRPDPTAADPAADYSSGLCWSIEPGAPSCSVGLRTPAVELVTDNRADLFRVLYIGHDTSDNAPLVALRRHGDAQPLCAAMGVIRRWDCNAPQKRYDGHSIPIGSTIWELSREERPDGMYVDAPFVPECAVFAVQRGPTRLSFVLRSVVDSALVSDYGGAGEEVGVFEGRPEVEQYGLQFHRSRPDTVG